MATTLSPPPVRPEAVDHRRRWPILLLAFVVLAALGITVAIRATTDDAGKGTGTGTIGPYGRTLLVGARSSDTSFPAMNAMIGPIKVTRLFYGGALPAKFDRQDVMAGVKIIVSYKTPSASTATYAKSIPATANVEIALHHEPEGPTDYPGDPAVEGPKFVAIFNAEADVIHRANSRIRVAFIGGGYQYKGGAGGDRGLGGYFIPTRADDYYLDSYLRHAAQFAPLSSDAITQNYIKELHKRGHQFNGFTEYGRGVIDAGSKFSQADATARAKLIPVDAAWIASQPNIDVWSYWYTTAKSSGDQWRFTDAASIKAWKLQESR